MRISEIIKRTRKLTGESQVEFGKRFGNTGTAVSLWEKDSREAPYKVIEFCLGTIDFTKVIKDRIDNTIKELSELKKLL